MLTLPAWTDSTKGSAEGSHRRSGAQHKQWGENPPREAWAAPGELAMGSLGSFFGNSIPQELSKVRLGMALSTTALPTSVAAGEEKGRGVYLAEGRTGAETEAAWMRLIS